MPDGSERTPGLVVVHLTAFTVRPVRTLKKIELPASIGPSRGVGSDGVDQRHGEGNNIRAERIEPLLGSLGVLRGHWHLDVKAASRSESWSKRVERLSRFRSRPTGTPCPPVQRVLPVAVFGPRFQEARPQSSSVRDGATPLGSSAAPATWVVRAQESRVARGRQGLPVTVRRRSRQPFPWPKVPPCRQSASRSASLSGDTDTTAPCNQWGLER